MMESATAASRYDPKVPVWRIPSIALPWSCASASSEAGWLARRWISGRFVAPAGDRKKSTACANCTSCQHEQIPWRCVDYPRCSRMSTVLAATYHFGLIGNHCPCSGQHLAPCDVVVAESRLGKALDRVDSVVSERVVLLC